MAFQALCKGKLSTEDMVKHLLDIACIQLLQLDMFQLFAPGNGHNVPRNAPSHASLEHLPSELLHDIFVCSGNPFLAQVSSILRHKLANDRLKRRLWEVHYQGVLIFATPTVESKAGRIVLPRGPNMKRLRELRTSTWVTVEWLVRIRPHCLVWEIQSEKEQVCQLKKGWVIKARLVGDWILDSARLIYDIEQFLSQERRNGAVKDDSYLTRLLKGAKHLAPKQLQPGISSEQLNDAMSTLPS